MSLHKDADDYLNYYDVTRKQNHLCRGKRLYKLITELGTGWRTGVEAVGGFSEDQYICKHFAFGGMEGKDGPPAVYLANTAWYKEQEPTFQPIQYTEEWLREHPDVVAVCQTLPDMRRPLDDEISSATCYSREKEWVVLGKEIVKPLHHKYEDSSDPEHPYYLQGELNIYLDDRELERMGADIHASYNGSGDTLCQAMSWAKEQLEKTIPKDLPLDRSGVKLYYCDRGYSDAADAPYNKDGVKKSVSGKGCMLWSYLKPKGKPYDEGFEYPPSRQVW